MCRNVGGQLGPHIELHGKASSKTISGPLCNLKLIFFIAIFFYKSSLTLIESSLQRRIEIDLIFVSCPLSAFTILSMDFCCSLYQIMGFAVVVTVVKKQLKRVSHLQSYKVVGNM